MSHLVAGKFSPQLSRLVRLLLHAVYALFRNALSTSSTCDNVRLLFLPRRMQKPQLPAVDIVSLLYALRVTQPSTTMRLMLTVSQTSDIHFTGRATEIKLIAEIELSERSGQYNG